MIVDYTPVARVSADDIDYHRWLSSGREPRQPYTRPKRQPRRPYSTWENVCCAVDWTLYAIVQLVPLVLTVVFAIAICLFAQLAFTGRL